jgi:hypothetical protein
MPGPIVRGLIIVRIPYASYTGAHNRLVNKEFKVSKWKSTKHYDELSQAVLSQL